MWGQAATHDLRARTGRAFDLNLAVMLCAAVIAGPIAAFTVALVPELVYLARRGRAFLHLGLAANIASVALMSVVAGLLLPPGGGGLEWRVPAVAVAMLLTSYIAARLILVVLRDGEHPGRLIRTEFVPVLPHQAAAVLVGVLSAVLVPYVGVFALLPFAVLVPLPQLIAGRLLQAPSVARLDHHAAAAVYRAALADELGLCRYDRKLTEQVAALVAGHTDRIGPAPNPLAIMNEALVATICLSHPSTQPAFLASDIAQVVIVAECWAELTAKNTPALSHSEALTELAHRSVRRDAPDALRAAQTIAHRERTLTEHVAAVPHLHRVPGPRRLRRHDLPRALARLAA